MASSNGKQYFIISLFLKDCVHIGLTLCSFKDTGGRRKLSTINGVLILSCPDVKGLKSTLVGFPGSAVVKNLPANAGDTGVSPGPGRSHMPRNN